MGAVSTLKMNGKPPILAGAVFMCLIALTQSGCSTFKGLIDSSGSSFPARPALPVIEAHELSCLNERTYRRLLMRDQLRRQYAEMLEAYHAH